ncbi:hypothetical protein [Chryseobacterium gossypii]|uniref:hypothetical protein n=1 Tax=Chryseobacterium gossypii TaxID=3231602 RepID=UPI0035269365
MMKITLILFYLLCLISCEKRNDRCNTKLVHNKYLFKNDVYYNIKLDSTNNILTLNIINKTGQDILILKPEILFLKEEIDESQFEENNRTKFETIGFDTIKKGIVNIKEYDGIKKRLINLWKRRKIRQNNNNYFDYGYNIEDYLAIIEKNKPYSEEYFINCTQTDKGLYKIIFDTGFREDSLVNNFINSNFLEEDLLFYKQTVDYPRSISIWVQ